MKTLMMTLALLGSLSANAEWSDQITCQFGNVDSVYLFQAQAKVVVSSSNDNSADRAVIAFSKIELFSRQPNGEGDYDINAGSKFSLDLTARYMGYGDTNDFTIDAPKPKHKIVKSVSLDLNGGTSIITTHKGNTYKAKCAFGNDTSGFWF